MDPDAALVELRALIYKSANDEADEWDHDRISELFQALDMWLMKGGFLPKDWAR
jgi:hypothetical protein